MDGFFSNIHEDVNKYLLKDEGKNLTRLKNTKAFIFKTSVNFS